MAKKFLELVAQDLLTTYGSNLSGVTVVLPGKRARLFMNQYLAQLSDKPVWAPRYQTIDELFLELSSYRKAEQIETVCLLYKIYSTLVDNPEPLDEFYSWGEIILSDFDDIDKHMAPADKIFSNVYDLHAIQESYITEEQEQALKDFFSNFSIQGNTELKRRFLRLWEIMPVMYARLRDELKARGYLYPGALYRDVVERYRKAEGQDAGKLQEMLKHTYCFVGFNVVDECEESLFRLLGEEHTRFYWDYDEMYVTDVKFTIGQGSTAAGSGRRTVTGSPWEAGLFLRQNLQAFPNRLPRECFDNLRHLKDITFVATSTDNAQARYIPEWIDRQLTREENDTAIVLCDEHLLQPVLHSLPEESPEKINVTMGFPLTDTPIYSFLSLLSSLQIDGWDASARRFRNTFVTKVRRHPYYQFVREGLKDELLVHQPDNLSLLRYLQSVIGEVGNHLANKGKEEVNEDGNKDGKEEQKEDVYEQLYGESLFQAHKVLNRFITLIEEDTLDVHPITLRRLIRSVLGSTSIPFHGEPAIGMQVMGLMETRNLDFSHLLMLNVGEGTMPKKADDNSLIPYTLREAFGLTTIRHHISVFAYYFFRLLQRTEHVTLVYNENTSGVKNNEMSRFMRQLMAETDLPIRHVRLTPLNHPACDQQAVHAEKTPEVMKMLMDWFTGRPLSPTAVNNYLDCPLKFYFRYVAGMKTDPEAQDGITAAEMGNIFHDAAQTFYDRLKEKYGTDTYTADMLRPFLEQEKKTALEKCINMKEYEASSGLPLIIRNVILEYLSQLIRHDLHHAPVTVREKEVNHYLPIELEDAEGRKITVRIGGRVDRLDQTEEGMKVVDYKTGGMPEDMESLDAIFEHKAKNAGYYLQTILYALAVSRDFNRPAKPTLFYVHRATDAKTYDPSLSFRKGDEAGVIQDVTGLAGRFLDKMRETIREIINPGISFCQTDKEDKCRYCDFLKICGRKVKNY